MINVLPMDQNTIASLIPLLVKTLDQDENVAITLTFLVLSSSICQTHETSWIPHITNSSFRPRHNEFQCTVSDK